MIKWAFVWLDGWLVILQPFNRISVMPGPEVIKPFSCSTQLSMKFFLLIIVKMPTIVGILTFMSRKNSILDSTCHVSLLFQPIPVTQPFLVSLFQSHSINLSKITLVKPNSVNFSNFIGVVVVVVLLFYVHGKHLRPCRDGQLT